MMRRLSPIVLLALAACQQQQPAPPPAPTPTPVAAPSASATPAATLARYVGSYPSDRVGPTSFLSDPAVRDAVASTVADPNVRERVLDAEAVAVPISIVEGRVLGYGCEPHNCGPRNWAILITPDGKKAAVCYYDQDAREARWYPEGMGAKPDAGCPSGE